MENESGRKIKAIRSDRGGDLMSKEFIEFCEVNGIRHIVSVSRSQKEKLELFSIWQGACLRVRKCQRSFGEKQCCVRSTC